MRKFIVPAAALSLLAPSDGASRVHQGAIVGGVAGHMVGHGKLGAAAGCAVGHHNAKKNDQQQQQPQPK